MNLLIAGEIFEPDIGGPATYSKKIATELSGQGWDVKLVCYSNQQQADNYSFKVFRILRSPLKPLHYYKYFKQLKKLAVDADLIYAMGPVSSGKPALKVKQQTGKKLIVKVVGDYAWEQARGSEVTDLGINEFQNKKFGGKIGYLQKIQRQVCQGADRVIVPSQYLKKIVVGWGVDISKISVVYNSATLLHVPHQENYSDLSDAVSAKSEDLIISIARLVSWKGFSLLIEIMSELVQQNSRFKLLILGDGPEKDYLESKIKGLNLVDNIRIELVDHQTRDKYFARAKMFVLNTGYEGLSHTVLESFAAGVPVITTNVGGNPELIQDGHNGILVEYNNKQQIKDAILKLNDDEGLRQKFVSSSKEILNHFTSEKMITNTITVLESV